MISDSESDIDVINPRTSDCGLAANSTRARSDDGRIANTGTRLLRCCMFIFDSGKIRFGAETVASDTTLAALKELPSTSGILESWRDEQLELWPLQQAAPCPQDLYSCRIEEFCQLDETNLFFLLKPRGTRGVVISCKSALELREQLLEDSPVGAGSPWFDPPAQHPQTFGVSQQQRRNDVGVNSQRQSPEPLSQAAPVAGADSRRQGSGFRQPNEQRGTLLTGGGQAAPPAHLPTAQERRTWHDPGLVRWTEDEVERLIDGVAKYKKKWRLIAERCDLAHRAGASAAGKSRLRDKWVNIEKNVREGKKPRQTPLSGDYIRKVLQIIADFRHT